MNAFNPKILELSEPNMDIQFVLDAYAAAATYVVSYMMKAQRGGSRLMDYACREAKRGDKDVVQVLRHMGNAFINAHEIFAQEAVYLTLGLKLRDSSRNFVFIPSSSPSDRTFLVKEDKLLNNQDPQSTDIAHESLIDRYGKRPNIPEFADVSLPYFAAWYERIRTKQLSADEIDNDAPTEPDFPDLTVDSSVAECTSALKRAGYKKRNRENVIRFVNYKEGNYPKAFYRKQLLFFYPWRLPAAIDPANSSSCPESDAILAGSSDFKSRYEELKSSILEERALFHKNLDVDYDDLAADLRNVDLTDIDWGESFNFAPLVQHMDERQGAGTLEEGENPDEIPDTYDLAQDLRTASTGSRVSLEKLDNIDTDPDYRQAVRSLNTEQRLFFNHFLHCMKRTPEQQRFHFLSGGAGVGKSVLTRAVLQAALRWYNLLPGVQRGTVKVLVMAPTGTAAFNINGYTIHSALEIPCIQTLRCYEDLSAEQKARLELALADVKLVIHDEISLSGRNMFNYINCRLQDITGNKSKPFGGINYLAVGDLFQIKAAFDQHIFLDSDDDQYGPLVPNFWRDNFLLYELQEIMRQRGARRFAELLNRLREGNHTAEDIALLKTRLLSLHPNASDYSPVARYFFSTHKQIDNHHRTVVPLLTGQTFQIPSFDRLTASYVHPTTAATILDKALRKDPRLTMGLYPLLELKLEMLVDMTCNVDTGGGLSNGAWGYLKLVDFSTDCNGLRQANTLWIHFADNVRIGRDEIKLRTSVLFQTGITP